MLWNKLKRIPNETEFLLNGHEQQRSKCLSLFPLHLAGENMQPSKSAKNLGVIFEQNFTFQYQIHILCCIQKHVSRDSAMSLETNLLRSQLDHCMSLFYGLPDKDIR